MGEVVVELTSTKTQLTIGFVKEVENAKEVFINNIALLTQTLIDIS